MRAEGDGGLERFSSPGKGRGLRALRPFQVGELLFSCPAYAYVLTVNERGNHCEHCFARKEGLSKCGRCKQAFYCDVECQKEDWPMHKLECSPMVVFGENWNPSETVRLTARILAKQKSHPERTPSEKLLAVKEFESHLDKLDNEKKDLIQGDISALHRFYSKHLEFPDNESLVTLFAQVNCNGFTIEDEELSHLGSAIFPDVALMNHSCCPNVIVTYKGTLAEVRAVQEINQGEEDKAKVKIRKLNDPPKAEAIRDMVRYARNVIEEFRRAKHYKSPSELLEICELSQEKMSSVFEDSNVYMLHMMYQAMGVCLYMQDWEGALRYGQKIIKPYSKHYPLYSLNVASMWLKLGRLYMGLENRAAGERALRKAMAIMEVAHGKDHPYISEIKQEIESH
ncbi:N-lysine methyltransferase SMYD2 isoform X2 [Pteronotus mesoamericanus]|uniref:N-lysine methyltransferase SMYD2 isoform X2 n=1 Tax=Pteronotus mesoamericanus TaxID=1884717 RepID=UPI0023ED3BFD|nr:N-lysine methyltransferase SMYD2 isoform X2 [Pteronotus parnellii mesoamericanus]